MTNRRKGVPILVPLFILSVGVAVLFNFASAPGFETLRAIDVIRLIAAGMCFGGALVMMFFVGRR
jgi:hypothetical protein